MAPLAGALRAGRPVGQGGVRGRTEATGRGVFFGIRQALSYSDDMEALGLSTGVEGKRFSTVRVPGDPDTEIYLAPLRVDGESEWQDWLEDTNAVSQETIVAENEDRTPWDPWRVQQGFGLDEGHAGPLPSDGRWATP